LTLSVTFLARQMAGRRQAISVAGSLLVHASFALYLLQPVHALTLAAPPAGQAEGDAANAVSVRLVDAKTVSQSAATSPAPLVEPPRAMHPSPAAAETVASLPAASAAHGPDSSRSEPAQAAASGAAGTVGAAPTDPELGMDYQRRLLAHIEPYKRYPEAASDARPRGTVQLVFQIDRAGRVLGVWVSRSSGSSVLDMAAIDTVRRAAPLPAIPAGLPDSMAVQLPVEFSAPG
jgi:protein TonB